MWWFAVGDADCGLNPVQRHQMIQQWIKNWGFPADIDEQRLTLSALVWFEQEREQLLNALDWANDKEHWDTVVSFVKNLGLFFQGRSYWQDGEKTCLMALQAAKKAKDRHEEGLSLNNLGTVYDSQSRWAEAIDCYQQSLTIFRGRS